MKGRKEKKRLEKQHKRKGKRLGEERKENILLHGSSQQQHIHPLTLRQQRSSHWRWHGRPRQCNFIFGREIIENGALWRKYQIINAHMLKQ